ncbi:hypothetical protein RFH42_11265 [Acinetobacter rudis]|uniref:hypothetical protein n=1 Tax=Acinetobacter rudis TaxID=632955 RepID=UPI00280D6506|nr:hypothetical protein [Acinetobacter rudis]MDQ8953540.1 hypothetical protein [Acinetobacter rudis]
MRILKQLCCSILIGLSVSSMAAEVSISKDQSQNAVQATNIITFFSARQHGQTLSTPTADPQGIYRVLISKSNEGYLVQDFFQANHQAQSSPVLLTDNKDLDRFQVESAVGEIRLYNRQGQYFNKQIYNKDHRITYLAGYSLEGKLLLEQIVNLENETINTKIWHSNGVLAFDLTSTTSMHLIDYKAQRRNGQAFNPQTCFMERSIALDYVALDPCVLQLKSLNEKYAKLWEAQMQ